MVNENINKEDNKLQKLLEIEGIKMPNFDSSNIEDFKDYSNEELENMKGEVDCNDNLTVQDKYNITRNIESIIKARNKEQQDIINQVNEEETEKKRKELELKRDKQKEKQKREAEGLIKQLFGDDQGTENPSVSEISQESVQEDGSQPQEEAQETKGNEDENEKKEKNLIYKVFPWLKPDGGENEEGGQESIQEGWQKNLTQQEKDILPNLFWRMDNIVGLEGAKSGEIDEMTANFWKGNYSLLELNLCKKMLEDPEWKNNPKLSELSESEHSWLIKNLETVTKEIEQAQAEEKDKEAELQDDTQEAVQQVATENEEENDETQTDIPGENTQDTQPDTPKTTEKSKPEKEGNKDYQEQIDNLSKANEELRKIIDNQTKIINGLLVARTEKNTEVINKMKEELRKSREEATKLKQERDKLLINNKKMKDLYFGELPKYNGNIVPLKTKAVEFKFGVNRIEGDQRVLSMPQLRLRKNIVSRHRLNNTIKKLNEIGDDPKRGVNYILTKADFLKGGAKIGTLCKKIGNYFKIRDVDSFDQKFNEQKKIFIDDLEAKMQGRMSEDDKKTMKAIKDRLDYYQKAYKRKFLTV